MTFEEAYIRLDEIYDTLKFDMTEASAVERAKLIRACELLLDSKDLFKKLSETSNDYSWEEFDD